MTSVKSTDELYIQKAQSNQDTGTKARIAEELKANCHRDTWAMVRLLRVLLELSRKGGVLPKSA